jgi:hypothetical protein
VAPPHKKVEQSRIIHAASALAANEALSLHKKAEHSVIIHGVTAQGNNSAIPAYVAFRLWVAETFINPTTQSR